MAHEALAMADGSAKYGHRNWRSKKVRARIYIAAALRHIHAWAEGQEEADDSGIHHLGHARACLGILLDAQSGGNMIDDRVAGPFPAVLATLNQKITDKDKEKLHG